MRIFCPLNHEAFPCLQEIEVATSLQLPSFHIVGLASREVAEAKERIRAAIEASGFEFPRRRVVLNLSPASVRKKGTGLDLAMALAVLSHGSDLDLEIAAWGELGLEGQIKPAQQLTRTLYACCNGKISHLIIAQEEYSEALQAYSLISKNNASRPSPPSIIPVSCLKEAWELIQKGKMDNQPQPRVSQVANEVTSSESSLLPLSPALQRLVGISCAGRHHLLTLGPRGTGKSHLLQWIKAVFPKADGEDYLKQVLIAELNQTKSASLQTSSIRQVSSQVKPAALIGGATPSVLRAGEFSLAHGGILIADELLEWARDSRELLREPLESGKITLSRAFGNFEFPAQFLLAANGNLCPCGGWPPELPRARSNSGCFPSQCKCSFSVRRAYLSRLSGPVLDRVDVIYFMTSYPPLEQQDSSETLHHLRKKVSETRKRAISQWGNLPGNLTSSAVEKIFQTNSEWKEYFKQIEIGSLRSRHKIIRLALTLASWDQAKQPCISHFTEAASYRSEGLGLWD